MANSLLEVRLTGSKNIPRESLVIFDEHTISSPGILYDDTSGVIKFKEMGQYSIKWWVATETTPKGAIGFHLISSKGGFIPVPGYSPIKTGQVTGFGVLDVEEIDTTLSLINMSATNMVISKKTWIKAYLLVTPIGSPSTRVYRGNLSDAGSLIEVPLGNGLYYRLENFTSTLLRLNLAPMNGPTYYDYRRFCSYNGTTATQGDYSDNTLINNLVIKDGDILNNSQEIHWALIRVQNPGTGLWSTYEVRFFASGGLSRVTIWVNVIEEEVSY